MEPERYTEILLKYKRSHQLDRAATDILKKLCAPNRLAESGELARTEGDSQAVVGDGQLDARCTTWPLADRCLERASIPAFSNEGWDCLLACASDLTVVVDAEHVVVYANRTPGGFSGTREDLIGLSLCDWLVPECRASFKTSIEQAFNSGQKSRQIVSCLRGDGDPSRQEASIGPITHGGRIIAVGVSFSDITAREKAEAKLRDDETLLRSIVKSVPKMVDILEGAICQGQAEQRLGRDESELFREQMIQIGRLIAVGKANTGLTNRIPQFLTAINMFVENALARLQKVSCPKGVLVDLQAALGTVNGMARNVERVRVFGRTAVGRNWIHGIDIGPIAADVVQLLEAEARLADVSICLRDMGHLPRVRMAEGDAEQLLFALIRSIVRWADGTSHHSVTVSAVVGDRDLQVSFSGDRACIQQERLNEILNSLGIDHAAVQGDNLRFHVANGILVRAGGRISMDGQIHGSPAFFITLPIAD